MEKLLAGRQLTNQDLEKLALNLPNLSNSSTLMEISTKVIGVVELKNKRHHWQCQRCGNEKEEQFAPLFSCGVYCLNCLKLGRISSQDELIRVPSLYHETTSEKFLTWHGQLSAEQQRASKAMCENLSVHQSIHIIQAVTGAGKTEMIFEVIEKVLQLGGRVAIASPRVDVCLELEPRIKRAFSGVSVISLHGTMTEAYQYTRIVIATTHQLWKFYHAFDLVIVDEIDAFPLSGDDSLHYAINNSVKLKGKLIYLTATPDRYIESLVRSKKAEKTILPARYHRYPLPEPLFKWIGDWRRQIQIKSLKGLFFKQLKQFLLLEGIKLIFMPDIQLAEALFLWLRELGLAEQLDVVHAKDKERKEKVQQLRNGKLSTLISTTILERGVTFINCQVMIVGSEDRAYSSSALIQMSGRVGRKKEYPTGTLWYAHYGISFSMLKARYNIQKMNTLARKLNLLNE